MGSTVISSRVFNQDVSKAKRNALKGPVIITDRGRPSHVLLSMETYEKIATGHNSIVDLLAMPGKTPINFNPPKLRQRLYRPTEWAE